jgi:3'-phosphoadenosine 5'-phosphosulfate sulfotransferase (PAPS reductase)/FAD synthetase
MTTEMQKPVRHILSLSGGKDSTALAIFMRDKVANMEYVFCDTEQELRETYEYLDRLEVYLGKEIKRLTPEGKGFEELLHARRGYLPSAQARWCTELLKIKPFEKYIGDDTCYSYVGIRADEMHRKGYISTKPNIIAQYPFIEAGITKPDVFRILDESGLGVPDYYKWRSRSGCYFCFFQQRIEWVGLLENHPDLYEKAKKFEKENPETGERYTWASRESLSELQSPERIEQIKREHARRQEINKTRRQSNQTLSQVFTELDLDDTSSEGCLVCHL